VGRGRGGGKAVRGREGTEEGEMVAKGERGLDLNICPGPPEFVVTSLLK